MTEREQEIQVSLYADKMLRQALDIKEMNKIHNPILETACNLIIELEDYANAEQKERIDELFYQIEIINELDFQMNLQNENKDE